MTSGFSNLISIYSQLQKQDNPLPDIYSLLKPHYYPDYYSQLEKLETDAYPQLKVEQLEEEVKTEPYPVEELYSSSTNSSPGSYPGEPATAYSGDSNPGYSGDSADDFSAVPFSLPAAVPFSLPAAAEPSNEDSNPLYSNFSGRGLSYNIPFVYNSSAPPSAAGSYMPFPTQQPALPTFLAEKNTSYRDPSYSRSAPYPTSKKPSTTKNVGKMTNKRTDFSQDDLDTLEAEYVVSEFARGARRDEIAERMGVRPRSVTIWFQNKRARVRQMAQQKALMDSAAETGKY